MNIVSQNHIFGEQLSSKISCFLEEFHVGKILKACNAYKVRGFSVSNVFKVAFENAFRNKSFYQQEKMDSSVIPFAKDTFYRFMNSSCVNWRKTLDETDNFLQVVDYNGETLQYTYDNLANVGFNLSNFATSLGLSGVAAYIEPEPEPTSDTPTGGNTAPVTDNTPAVNTNHTTGSTGGGSASPSAARTNGNRGTYMKVTGQAASSYYGTGANAEVDFSAMHESSRLIDLGNSGNYGKSVANFQNITKAVGANGADNAIAGADGKNNVLVGGANGTNQLYGGKGGNDRMVGNKTSVDTFYFGADSGEDTIQDYTQEDTVSFLSGGLMGAAMDAMGHLQLLWQDEQGNQSKLTFDENMKDMVVSYEVGGEKHGAKFGEKLTVTDDTADFVNYYNSGNASGEGELDLSGNTKKTIWLDGSHGVTYDGFNKVDARNLNSDMELAGGARDDQILGGNGSAALWGGVGGNDKLAGGTGYNEFYFGKGNGGDLVTSFNNGDSMMFYDVSLDDIQSAAMQDGDMVVTLKDGSSLTIQNYNTQGSASFQLTDSGWSYNKETSSWVRTK